MEKPSVFLKNEADSSTLATKITGTARVSRVVGDMTAQFPGRMF